MKTMTIEKKLLFDEAITAVKEVHARHELVYEQEADGSIRACGPLYLEGIMVNALVVMKDSRKYWIWIF